MMDHRSIIKYEVNAFKTLTDELEGLLQDALTKESLDRIIKNGIFSPAEDEQISYWFARYLTVHSNFWQTVEISIQNAGGMNNLSLTYDYQYFVLGYACVCQLIRMDRFLVSEFATNTLVQRKLNEALPKYTIERKQFISLQKAMLKPSNAIRIYQAHRILKKRKKAISIAVLGSPVEGVFNNLANLEHNINLNRRDYFIAWLRTRRLSLRRRGASAKQKSIFTILEYSGRFASEITLPLAKKVTPLIRKEIKKMVQPGDVFITRHHHAFTNLFLPGYWPHAALYIGNNEQDAGLLNEKNWTQDKNTFEALKDGVHFRSLDETLNVDAFVLIRPNFTEDEKNKAIQRVIQHANKGYNFDFDFFRSDQLVCTEVVYRAYDGINGKTIPLKERVGKQTLSAEDLLDLTLDSDWADVIAIYGTDNCEKQLLTGLDAISVLRQSYRG